MAMLENLAGFTEEEQTTILSFVDKVVNKAVNKAIGVILEKRIADINTEIDDQRKRDILSSLFLKSEVIENV